MFGGSNYQGVHPAPIAHGDPRFVVLTDFKWTYAGTTVEPQPTTRNDISLSHFISSLDKDDKALIYFAGHGVLLENEMPSYQALVATNPEYKHSLIDAPALKDAIFGSLRSAAALVSTVVTKIALDACCSGNIISLPTTDRATKKGLENTVGNEIILIAAAQRDGRAFSTRIGGSETHHLRGVMTHHLLNYLRGWPFLRFKELSDSNKVLLEYPIAKVERLRMHLERECTAATQKDVGGPQKPVISLSHRSIKRLTLG
ncbi:hypothetical protein FRB99_005359 [Tulasnella sp. 403]|nr:hypothetical protein FRB99_005359 [Tulasnella sp. 403]